MKRNKLSKAVRIYVDGKLKACFGQQQHQAALMYIFESAWHTTIFGPYRPITGIGSESGALAIHFGSRAH